MLPEPLAEWTRVPLKGDRGHPVLSAPPPSPPQTRSSSAAKEGMESDTVDAIVLRLRGDGHGAKGQRAPTATEFIEDQLGFHILPIHLPAAPVLPPRFEWHMVKEEFESLPSVHQRLSRITAEGSHKLASPLVTVGVLIYKSVAKISTSGARWCSWTIRSPPTSSHTEQHVRINLVGSARLGGGVLGIGHGARAQLGQVYMIVHPDAFVREEPRMQALSVSAPEQLIALGTEGPSLIDVRLLSHLYQRGFMHGEGVDGAAPATVAASRKRSCQVSNPAEPRASMIRLEDDEVCFPERPFPAAISPAAVSPAAASPAAASPARVVVPTE